jgi:DNA/RNA endonuclease G (NUC1)
MKELCAYILIILVSLNVVNAQKTHENELYKVVYSEVYQQPLLLEYSIPYGETINKKEKSFKKLFKLIKTSDHSDYSDTLFDKGHLAPVKAFASIRNDDQLYSYLNCALMHRSLNRGAWAKLEKYELGLKNKNNEVNVSISLIFDNKSFKVEGGATVPTYFIKTIEVTEMITDDTLYINDYIEVSREVYILPNNGRVKGVHYTQFKSDILSLSYKDTELIKLAVMEIDTLQYKTYEYKTIEFEPIKLAVMKLDTLQYKTIEFEPIKLAVMELDTLQYKTYEYKTIEFEPIKLAVMELDSLQYKTYEYKSIEFEPIKLEVMELDSLQYKTYEYKTIEFEPIKLEVIKPMELDTLQYKTYEYKAIEFKPIKLEVKKALKMKKFITSKSRDDKF